MQPCWQGLTIRFLNTSPFVCTGHLCIMWKHVVNERKRNTFLSQSCSPGKSEGKINVLNYPHMQRSCKFRFQRSYDSYIRDIEKNEITHTELSFSQTPHPKAAQTVASYTAAAWMSSILKPCPTTARLQAGNITFSEFFDAPTKGWQSASEHLQKRRPNILDCRSNYSQTLRPCGFGRNFLL